MVVGGACVCLSVNPPTNHYHKKNKNKQHDPSPPLSHRLRPPHGLLPQERPPQRLHLRSKAIAALGDGCLVGVLICFVLLVGGGGVTVKVVANQPPLLPPPKKQRKKIRNEQKCTHAPSSSGCPSASTARMASPTRPEARRVRRTKSAAWPSRGTSVWFIVVVVVVVGLRVCGFVGLGGEGRKRGI